jgi:serine protease AprX
MESVRRRVTDTDIARGLRWVIDNKKKHDIRIVSIAVGADEPELLDRSVVDQMVEEAVQQGILVIVAGGNRPGSPIVPPASAPSAITVGGYDDGNSLNEQLRIPYPSTFGTTLDGYEKPNILGLANSIPGPLLPNTDQGREAIILFDLLRAGRDRSWEIFQRKRRSLTEVPRRMTPAGMKIWLHQRIEQAKFISPHHKSMEGTSIAAAIVSSVASQMLEANPMLTPQRIRQILLRTAEPIPHLERERQGHGVINARNAVHRALLERHRSDKPGPDFFDGFAALIYEDHEARSVFLAGDFNEWNPEASPFHEVGSGRWSALVRLPARDQARYKIIIDGEKWIPDPFNEVREPDGYGGWNSVLDRSRETIEV